MVSAGSSTRSIRGALELSLGDVDAAHRSLAPLPAAARTPRLRRARDLPLPPRSDRDARRAAARLAEAGAARRAGGIAERFPRSWAVAAAARCRGLLAAEARRPRRGVRAVRGRARAARRARGAVRAGTDAAPLRRGAQAGEAEARGARGAGRGGARLRGRSERRSGRRGRAASSSRISGAAPGASALTETEQRIAELATSGRSNKQIAAELHITVRTVESNLTRVYRKLGVSSRGQLAQLDRP